jgi:hypothetical protein
MEESVGHSSTSSLTEPPLSLRGATIEHRQVLRGGESSADVRLFQVPHTS